MTCTKGYVRTGFNCVACEGGPDQEGAIHAIAGLCFVLFVIFSILFMKAKEEEYEDDKAGKKKKKKEKKTEKETEKEMEKKKETLEKNKKRRKRQSGAGSRLLGDQIMIQRISGGSSSSDSSGLYKNDVQLLQDRLKVVFGWMQVFGSLCVTYEDVPWPPMFESFSVNVGVMVNLGKCCCFSLSKCFLHLYSYHCCSSQTSWACLDSRLAVSICLSSLNSYCTC
jgi:hypothetical protein